VLDEACEASVVVPLTDDDDVRRVLRDAIEACVPQ